MRFLLLLLCLGLLNPATAQRMLSIKDKEGRHTLVTKVTKSSYYAGLKPRDRIRIDNSGTAILPASHYMPGYIQIKDHKLTHITTKYVSDSYHVEFKADFVANRDFDDLYIIVVWNLPSRPDLRIAIPVGKLKAGWVDRGFRLHSDFVESRYQIYFFSNGFEVLSGKLDWKEFPTPWKRNQSTLEASSANVRAKPVTLVDPSKLLHGTIYRIVPFEEEGETPPEPVQANLQATINEKGYVEEVKRVGTCPDAAYEMGCFALKLWEFRPAIKNGEPIESKVVIPFRFPGRPERAENLSREFIRRLLQNEIQK